MKPDIDKLRRRNLVGYFIGACQVIKLLMICSFFHCFKLLGNLIDREEGVIELQIGRLMCRALLKSMKHQVEIHGAENVDDLDGPYLVAANHASYLDWVVLLGYYPTPLRIIAKKELAKIPVVGSFLKLRGILIDRSKGRTALQAIADATDSPISWPIQIYPEGTRSLDGVPRKFKRPGLKMFLEKGWPVVPVTLTGTFPYLPRNAIRYATGGKFKLVIGKPIFPGDGVGSDAKLEEKMAKVEQTVHEAFAEHSEQKSEVAIEGRLSSAA